MKEYSVLISVPDGASAVDTLTAIFLACEKGMIQAPEIAKLAVDSEMTLTAHGRAMRYE